MCKGREEDELRHKRKQRKGMGIGHLLFLSVVLAGLAIWYFKLEVPYGKQVMGMVSGKLGMLMEGSESGSQGGAEKAQRQQERAAPPAQAQAPSSGAGEQTITLNQRSDVLFEFGSASLKSGAGGTLRDAARVIRQRPNATVVIRGYTASIGSEQANLALSRQRAESVRDWMVKGGIPARQLSVLGMGAKDPVAANTKPDGSDNPPGREQNRRVTVSVTGS